MKAIELARGEGKTTALVEYMLEPGNEEVMYVAPTRDQAQRVAYPLFLEAGGEDTPRNRGRFLTFNEMTRRMRPRERYVFDEADAIIGALASGTVERIAFSPPSGER